MSDETDRLIPLLTPFGLTKDEVRIYLYLAQNGYSTALALSRRLHLARTKVYRLLDKLIDKQLVVQKVESRGMQFGATDPKKLEFMLADKEREVKSLKLAFPELMHYLNALQGHTITKSQVLYYTGIEGLRQVSYNITRADRLLRVFEMEHMGDFLPKDFAEDIRRRLVKKNIFTRDLTNKKSFPEFTQVTEMISRLSEFRYIDPKLLKINFEVLIYNNVYATYTYKDKDIFCVEIYNEQLAQMQKQLYDFVWTQAKKMSFLNEYGAAQVFT